MRRDADSINIDRNEAITLFRIMAIEKLLSKVAMKSDG